MCIRDRFIYNAVNAGKDIPAIDPFVIIGSGGSNRKVITFVPVPFLSLIHIYSTD